MRKLFTFAIMLILISCAETKKTNALEQEAYNKINEWYYKASPVYNTGDEIRADDDERKRLEQIVKIKHEIPEKFDIVHQEKFITQIDKYQATIKVNYYCKAKDETTAFISDTYYYDDNNTPVPILLKTESSLQHNYSIIEQFLN